MSNIIARVYHVFFTKKYVVSWKISASKLQKLIKWMTESE